MSSTKQEMFHRLAAEARACLVCEAMKDKTAVLSELNGCIDPKVFFVAEAPGRQGADRTRTPFHGDKSGENLQVLLDSIGLDRSEIFITNAVLCSPRKQNGANRRPSRSEIANCSDYLSRTIALIDPRIIVALGSVALEALRAVDDHRLTLRSDAGKAVDWNCRRLIPLYHPSPQVMASHRNMKQQLRDYKALGDELRLMASGAGGTN